jgi:signal transduction histidine kinase/CheY-like chemotaxis protein
MTEHDLSRTDAGMLRAVMAASGDGLLCVDTTGRISYANPSAFEMLGLSEDAIGSGIDSIPVPAILERLEHLLEGGHASKTPTEAIVGGRTLLVRFWRSRHPKVIGVSIHDDTETTGRQDRAEAVLNATTDGLIVLNPSDVIKYINPAATRMLELTRKDAIGVKVDLERLFGIEDVDLPAAVHCNEVMDCGKTECPAYDADDLRCWLMSGTRCENGPEPFASKRCRCAECEVRRMNADSFDAVSTDEYRQIELDRDGGQLVIQVRVSPVVDREGDYAGRVLALRDITNEHEIAQMKNEFVSTVSHELRTPLTSIKGYVDLILDGDAGDINEIQQEFLGIVKENSDRLVELINDMLDISRIESGRIHFKVQPMAVDDVVEGSVDTFKAVLSQTGRSVKVRLPDDLPPVAADPDRVGQVLINYISNALKYSPNGGEVVVTAKRDGNAVRISVRDHGLGISREDQKRLFTKFYRVDSAMTRDIGGTGLGLSICKSIIELLGGEIGVKSRAGEGSTFWFTLPVAPPEMIRVPRVAGAAKPGATVLVVDRDEEIASLIETYLHRRGYKVVKAYNAEDAIREARRVRPEVITLDVILDDDDGFELLQRFKEFPETANIPVVVLSIVCDEGRSCRIGAADYLEKPIDKARLLAIVDELVGSTDSPLVLIVDDDRDVVAVLSETLRKRGFAVAAAYDGAEALAVIEQRHPHLVLLDLRMPKVDGYEVIKRVKSHPEWGAIPIVVMTGYPIDRSRTDLLDLTVGHFHKPMSPEDIAAKVESMLVNGEILTGEAPPEPAKVGGEVS